MTSPPARRLSPRKQPRQQRALVTRARILTAAAHVFAEYGYAAGTTNRIAEAAELSIGSLYQYFPNKDAILMELMSAHVEAGSTAIRDRLAGGLPESLDDAVRVFVRAAIDNHRDAPRLHRVLFDEAPRPPAFVRRLHEMESEAVAATQTLLDAHPAVTVPNTGLAARLVVATIESLVHRLIAAPEPIEPRPFEDALVTMLVRYLTADPLT